MHSDSISRTISFRSLSVKPSNPRINRDTSAAHSVAAFLKFFSRRAFDFSISISLLTASRLRSSFSICAIMYRDAVEPSESDRDSVKRSIFIRIRFACFSSETSAFATQNTFQERNFIFHSLVKSILLESLLHGEPFLCRNERLVVPKAYDPLFRRLDNMLPALY